MFFYSYLFRSNKHFKYLLYCTSSSTLLDQYLRGIDIFAAKILSRSSSTKIQHIHKKEIAAQLTSHRLAESARAKALRRARLYHLHYIPMPRRSRLHQHTILPHCWISWSSGVVRQNKEGIHILCVRALTAV